METLPLTLHVFASVVVSPVKKRSSTNCDSSSTNDSGSNPSSLKPLLFYFTDTEPEDSSEPSTGQGQGVDGRGRRQDPAAATPSSGPSSSTLRRRRRLIGPISRSFDDTKLSRRRMDGREDSMEDEDSAAIDGNSSLLVNNLREKVSALDDKCDRLDREKSALADLLASKKREMEQLREHYAERIKDLEDESQRLKAEKARLIDKLKLPESERSAPPIKSCEIIYACKSQDVVRFYARIYFLYACTYEHLHEIVCLYICIYIYLYKVYVCMHVYVFLFSQSGRLHALLSYHMSSRRFFYYPVCGVQ